MYELCNCMPAKTSTKLQSQDEFSDEEYRMCLMKLFCHWYGINDSHKYELEASITAGKDNSQVWRIPSKN